MLASFISLLLNIFASLGYLGVLVLMTIESSFVPFPSEIVVPPAAYLASQGSLNVWLVLLMAVVGSLVGALINYYLSKSLGRTIIYRLAKTKLARIILITPEKIKKSEEYFLQRGEISTFVGRLIPVVRQLISIPAGLAKMPVGKFIFYTFLGSLVWSGILTALGYFLGASQEIWLEYYHAIEEVIYIILLIAIVWFIWKRVSRRKA